MGSALFWYKLVFMAEIIIAEILFTYKLKRRNYYPVRLAVSIVACFAIAFLYPVPIFEAWYASIMFFALFIFSVIGLKFCYEVSWINIFFCSILSYTVQHLAFLLYNTVIVAMNLVEAGAIGTYLDVPVTNYNAYTAIAYGVSYYLVYWLAYLFCGTKIKRNQDLNIGNMGLFMLSSVILLVMIIFNAVVVYYSANNYDKLYLVMNFLGGMVACILVLTMQFNLFDKKKLKRDMDALQLLRLQEQEQYAMSKENIDLINIKCHDLKHRVSAFRGRLEESEVDELEKAVMIYDSIIKTGNEVLDVILTEKSLKCSKNRIKITYTIDDSNLAMLSISDLYSLFGNLIDNAIEAVMKLTDENKRVICLNIKTAEKLLSVHIENYFVGDISFAEGLPETTKGDKRYHGFGMKSVKLISEKYDGNMIARADGELFKIDILIPVKKAEAV